MKRLLSAMTFLAVLAVSRVQAAEEPKLLTDFGAVKLYIPLTSIDTVAMWDLVSKKALVGGETPLAAFKRLTGTFGAVTSFEGQGAPFLGTHFAVGTPADKYFVFSNVKLGLFVSRDFNARKTMYGLKAATNIF